MAKLINENPDRNLTIIPAFMGRRQSDIKGTFIVVTTGAMGFVTRTIKADSPYAVLSRHSMAMVVTIAWKPEANCDYTHLMYSRKGKKVWMSEHLAIDLKVGDVNGSKGMDKTCLYSQVQYHAVNAEVWTDYVFRQN